MKKIISIILAAAIVFFNLHAFGISVSGYENLAAINYKPLIDVIDATAIVDEELNTKLRIARMDITATAIFQIGGEIYCFHPLNRTAEASPVCLSADHLSGITVIWTGEYYYTKASFLDGRWYDASKYAYPLELIDEDGNVVKSLDLRKKYKAHAIKIGYLNNVYYCELSDGKKIKSTDFENWEETDEAVPQQICNIMMAEGKVSLDKNTFASVNFENDPRYRRIYTLGNWLVYCDENMNFYFSNDGIYFVKVDYPPEMLEYDTQNNRAYYGLNVYEYGDEIICDMEQTDITSDVYNPRSYSSGGDIYRFRIPKNEVYSRLDELKSVPHVLLDDSYLGFSQSPVMEDDRTLVPMRFLFEQMGADVNWNDATQTATATISNTAAKGFVDSAAAVGLAEQGAAINSKAKPLVANTAGDINSVTFSIDDTNATVNGEAAAMDVPARLINDQTFVPLRFLSENLGYNVQWDESTNTAIITTE